MLEDLLSREKIHNAKVSQFMGSVRSEIIRRISNNDYVCQIMISLPESTVDLNRNYSIHLILGHFKNEIEGYHNDLRVDVTDTNHFKLHGQDDNSNLMAVGDRETLECLKRKLDEYYETNVGDKVKKFRGDGTTICNEYNTEFVPRIMDISDIIEEEDDLKGGCGYNFCPRKERVWYRTKGQLVNDREDEHVSF